MVNDLESYRMDVRLEKTRWPQRRKSEGEKIHEPISAQGCSETYDRKTLTEALPKLLSIGRHEH